RSDGYRRDSLPENGAHHSAALRTDDGTALGDLDGIVRQFGGHVRHLQRCAGCRYVPAGGCVCTGLPAAAGSVSGRTAVVAAGCGNGETPAQLGRGPTGDYSRTSTFDARPNATVPQKDDRVAGDRPNMIAVPTIAEEISERFGSVAVAQQTHDHIPTFWVAKDRTPALLRFLKEEVEQPYKMLYDLSAIDERMRVHRDGQPASD